MVVMSSTTIELGRMLCLKDLLASRYVLCRHVCMCLVCHVYLDDFKVAIKEMHPKT